MPIDFFIVQCQTENIQNKSFGLCDDEDMNAKTPAYADTTNPEKWIATVKNLTGKPINFTAVDNCIVINRPDGLMDNRCDAMLTNEDNIVFVELKEQKSDWISHAVEQLQTTIDHFKANHDITRYRYKRAFACNKKHPKFIVSYKEKMNAFYKKNKMRLNLQKEIIFK